jgi:hypothetical protein
VASRWCEVRQNNLKYPRYKGALFSLRNAASGTVFRLNVLPGASACIEECIGSSHRPELIATRSVISGSYFFSICLFVVQLRSIGSERMFCKKIHVSASRLV